MYIGELNIFEPFWREHATKISVLVSGWHRMAYNYSDGSSIFSIAGEEGTLCLEVVQHNSSMPQFMHCLTNHHYWIHQKYSTHLHIILLSKLHNHFFYLTKIGDKKSLCIEKSQRQNNNYKIFF
ncbi:hypothetical protein Ahy_B05g073783 isoform B [Arachis hypogaea]|uniref:Alliinase C-terminal domain-containing protein n=1 Tax=Arachis hypogaea TaxID=3818 RepID=A0A444YWY0_ARAHY|nr:hypothetical protein Ahy_B05g073783 isoform B [Arachis hypogaea]